MWCFTRYGFFSLSYRKNGSMQIRARCREHLVLLEQRFDVELKKYKIIETLQGDYAYRIELPKRLAALIMRELVEEQTWDNFKKETKRYQTQAAGHPKYEKVLMDVYFDAAELQEGGPYSSGVLSGLRSLNNKDFQFAGTQVKDVHAGEYFKVPDGETTVCVLPPKSKSYESALKIAWGVGAKLKNERRKKK